MKIRFAKENDLKQIIVLCGKHALFEKTEYNPKNKAELLAKHLFNSSNTIKCLVVELNNDILGYATFIKQFSTWDANFYIYLDCLYLEENIRSQGVGRQLMNQIKTYAQSQNCDSIQWQTPDFNKRAINFYNKIGGVSKAKERFTWNI